LPALGHGAMAAHQPLELWILVRIQVPQPDMPRSRGAFFLNRICAARAAHCRVNPVYVLIF
jgi:hypothetical protein